jgi:hypothetical protein
MTHCSQRRPGTNDPALSWSTRLRPATAGGVRLVLLFLVAWSVHPAAAQSPPQPARPAAESVAPNGQKLDDACMRKSDQKPGVVKRDACGRWYCGRIDVKDFAETRPNLAAELGCTWQLEGQRCRCVRNFSVPKDK